LKKTDPPIIVETEYATTIEKAWLAITSLDQMHKWFFPQIPSFVPVVGFTTEFLIVNEDREFTHLWEIIEVKEEEKIKCRWRYQEYPGIADITFELLPIDDKVKFTLTAEVIKDFPENVEEFKRESGVGGWNYFINESLKGFLESNE